MEKQNSEKISDLDAGIMVDLISAFAAMSSCRTPSNETLKDLNLPPSVHKKAKIIFESKNEEDIPSAKDILNVKEDGFISALAVILIPQELREKRRIVVITRPFGFITKLDEERIAIIAPTRFETDFASIPPWALWLISPFGKHSEAAVIHDWLYALGPKRDHEARHRADRVFRAALEAVGIGIFKRTIMYYAVRFGGKSAFGCEDELNFRSLERLELIRPAPAIEPYKRTVASTADLNKE